MSTSSSEDEFESADEGDLDVEEIQQETSSGDSHIAKPSTPTVCESVVDCTISSATETTIIPEPQGLDSLTVSQEPSTTTEPNADPDVETLNVSELALQNKDTIEEVENEIENTTAENIQAVTHPDEKRSADPTDSNLKKTSEENGSLETKSEVISISDKTDPGEAKEISITNEEPAPIPTEIASKISTRNISSKMRQKSKPSLGAKKLGAVRISQPFPESDFPAREKTGPEHGKSWSQETFSKETHEPSTDNSGWGGWFAPPKSLLSSVSSLTNQIIATVETGLNIPDPEQLAKEDVTPEPKAPLVMENRTKELEEAAKPTIGFGQLMGGVSNLTRFVENTSTKVLATGLDTLELIGKKTITALQQSDPGLKKTKAALVNPLQQSNDRPCLSQILREAKERSEDPQRVIADDDKKSIPSFKRSTTLFEDHHGLFHLEALEMLSQQCESRISSQIRRVTAQRRAILEEITVLCTQTDDDLDENIDPDEFDVENVEQCLTSLLDKIGIQLPLKRLIDAVRSGFELSINISEDSNEKFISEFLNSLAQVTSMTVELFHKSAELILMADKPANPQISGKVEAESFRSIALLLGREVLRLGSYYANQIIRNEHSSGRSSEYSTEIYFEASNYNSYIQNSLKLLVPILQTRVV